MTPTRIHPDNRTLRTRFDGKPAWEKHAIVHARAFTSTLFNAVAAVSGRAAFRSTHNPDAVAALSFEAGRLRYMKARGYLVPDVLEQHPDRLILSDVGTSLTGALREADIMERNVLLSRAVIHLAYVHSRGDYHGRSVAKDMTVQDNYIGLIDFEHDPLAVMPLPAAQGRDFWLLLATSARYFPGDDTFAPRMTELYSDIAPREAVAALKDNASFICKVGAAFNQAHTRFNLGKVVPVGMNRGIVRALSR